MTQLHQCALCLSCGSPFLPKKLEADTYVRKGTQSVLYLDQEFKDSHEIRRKYDLAKYTDVKQAGHIFHDSHHQLAIEYMCNRHTGDANVRWSGGGVRVVPDGLNGPMPYLKNPKGKKDKGPMVATWNAPPEGSRLDFHPLLDRIVFAADQAGAKASLINLDETFAICQACNVIMTQQNNMSFHLGLKRMRAVNTAPLLGPGEDMITQWKANTRRASPRNAYGRWRRLQGAPGRGTLHPHGTAGDDLTPAIAYYLHMCLPFLGGGAPDPFMSIGDVGMREPARRLYLHLSWIILEIACLATLRDMGKLYDPVGARSHGPQQHSGALDIYVSFFIFKLMQFECGERVEREGLDFVQWHQKYYWDAINCKGLFPHHRITHLIADRVYSAVTQGSRPLVEEICRGLVRLYDGDLAPLISFVTNQGDDLPMEIRSYFLPLPAMRELRRRSAQQVNSFISLLPPGPPLRVCTGHPQRLSVSARQFWCQRPAVQDDPAVPRLPQGLSAAAGGFQAELAVAGARAHPQERPRHHHARGLHPLRPVQPAGPPRGNAV